MAVDRQARALKNAEGVRDRSQDLNPLILNPWPGFVFVDCEASGLHHTSYPIEVGWAACDLSSEAFLVRPADEWNEYDWSVVSERVHGIRRDECIAKGINVIKAAHRINAAFEGRHVYSDAPDFEARWLGRLFHAADVKPTFAIEDWESIVLTACERHCVEFDEVVRKVERVYPRTHRADADALCMAATFRAVTDAEFLKALDGMPNPPRPFIARPQESLL